MFKKPMFKKLLFNYQCPNGNPPELCWHTPQLILNAASYFESKQQLRQQNIESQAQVNLEQTTHIAQDTQNTEGKQKKQKQRRRG